VRVEITADTLTVDDDGAGPVDERPGNGLHGLAERARRSGARVEAARGPLGGYRLLVTTQEGPR
jgi:two-component system sensor histidine kinase DesK